MKRIWPAHTRPTARDARIDWLRGAAALMVLGHHLFAPLSWEHPLLKPLAHTADWFWLGVPVFFVLSGRCIGTAWLREKSAGSFALHRIKRIYPPYLASLVVCLGVIGIRWCFVGVNDVTPLPASLYAVLAPLTLATAPATGVPTINWVYWSLTYEISYYALCALLLLLPSIRFRLCALIALHLVFACMDLAGAARSGTVWFFIDNWPLFAAGLGLGLLKSHRTWAIVTLAISAAHLLASFALRGTSPAHVAGLITVLALSLPSKIWSPTASRPLARIGIMSYSLYLTHVPVGVFLFLQPVHLFLGSNLLSQLASLLAGVSGSLVFAWFFHRHIESRWISPNRPSTP